MWVNLSPEQFRFPDKLKVTILEALDVFVGLVASQLGATVEVLSDYRPYDPQVPGSLHPQGLAVDVSFPGADPLRVYELAEESGLFDGLGVYLNDRGAVSFHFDKRGYPARWGALITHPVDPATGVGNQVNEYLGLAPVLALVRSGATSLTRLVKQEPFLSLQIIAALALLFWLFFKR